MVLIFERFMINLKVSYSYEYKYLQIFHNYLDKWLCNIAKFTSSPSTANSLMIVAPTSLLKKLMILVRFDRDLLYGEDEAEIEEEGDRE